MAESLAIASGKGGVGKTTIAVNLDLTFAKEETRCMLLDADLGMANSHILLGINPKSTIADVINGKSSIDEVIVNAPLNLKFLSGGSGLTEMLSLDKTKRLNFIRSFSDYSESFDQLLIDVSAGAEDSSLSIISAADRVLIVLVNEPTSFMDAFTLIKACYLEHGYKEFCVAINMANSEMQAKQNFNKFKNIINKFYDVKLNYVGYIQTRDTIKQSILKRKPVVLEDRNKDIISLFKNIQTNILSSPINVHNGIKFFYKSSSNDLKEA